MLFYRTDHGDLSKIPIISSPPPQILEDLNIEIDKYRSEIQSLDRDIRKQKTEPDVRQEAAECEACNLCMVCAGEHRRYESWPPGTGECFCTKMKGGKPLREEPCKLCDDHDLELRNVNRNKRQGLSRRSSLKNKLNSLINQRRNLFLEHQIEVEVISE